MTPYGYADTVSPIQTRAPGKVIIAIMGGSVAWSFHMHGTARLRNLLENDSAMAGSEIVFVNLAVSGYKQPQQLMTMAYLLVLGAQFDLVLNIDGFNEAALYEAARAAMRYKPLSRYPAVERDFSLLLADGTSFAQVVDTIHTLGIAEVTSIQAVDLFRGKNVPEGQKSLAYAFTYRSPEKTLTDAEVNATHGKIIEAFKAQLKAAVRE